MALGDSADRLVTTAYVWRGRLVDYNEQTNGRTPPHERNGVFPFFGLLCGVLTRNEVEALPDRSPFSPVDPQREKSLGHAPT